MPQGHRAEEVLVEPFVSTDDVDVGRLERLCVDRSLRRRHVDVGAQSLQGDLALVLESKAELLVLAAVLVEVLHRLGLLGDTCGLCQQALADAGSFCHTLALDTRCFRVELLTHDLSFCHALLLGRGSQCFLDLSVCETLLAGAFGLCQKLLAHDLGLCQPLALDGVCHRLLDADLHHVLLFFTSCLCEHLAARDVGFCLTLTLASFGVGLTQANLGHALIFHTLRFGLHLLAQDVRLDLAALLEHVGLGLFDAHLGESFGGLLGLDTLGDADLGLGDAIRRVEVGVRLDDALARLVLGDFFVRLGALDVDDELLLRLGLGADDGRLLVALGVCHHAKVLDVLLFLRHRLLDGDAVGDDLGDLFLLDLDLALLLDALDLDLALALDDLEGFLLLDRFLLDDQRALASLLGHLLFALLVDRLDVDRLLGFELSLALEGDLLGLLLLAGGALRGADDLDLALLASLGVSLLALVLEHGDLGLEVILPDLLLGRVGELVGAHALLLGALGDLADTFGVEDVVRIERVAARLLEVIDGDILEGVAVQVVADDGDDLIAELLTSLVELFELELLTGGLERLGELGAEQLLDRVLVGCAKATHHLGHAEHVLAGLVDAHEERHADVCADVILTDQAVMALTLDLDRLDRDVHVLGTVHERDDDGPCEEDLGPVRLVHDQRLTLQDFLIELGDERQDTDDQQRHRADDHQAKNRQWSVTHEFFLLPGSSLHRAYARRDTSASREPYRFISSAQARLLSPMHTRARFLFQSSR